MMKNFTPTKMHRAENDTQENKNNGLSMAADEQQQIMNKCACYNNFVERKDTNYVTSI